MQPYFFPYIGYFQLMRLVDVFVLYDDVQYIKGGWINRNRILVNGAPSWLTFSVTKAPLEFAINQREYVLDAKETDGLVNQIANAYGKAPFFNQIFPWIASLIRYETSNVALYNQNLLMSLAQHLGLTCRFEVSSSLVKDNLLKGQERVIDICSRLGATHYVNPIGGIELYARSAFDKAGIELNFLKARQVEYTQYTNTHVPFLSIIDVLMFNGIDGAIALLDEYDLLK